MFAQSAAQSLGPIGEETSGHEFIAGKRGIIKGDLLWDNKQLSIYTIDFAVLKWTPPFGKDIVDAMIKRPNHDIVFILLSDGSVYQATQDPFGWNYPLFKTKLDPSNNFAGYGDMLGDAVYCRTGPLVYVSRDTSQTWQVDTTGVGSIYKSGIALDTAQFVYLSTDNGLFKQHPDSNVWRKVTSLNKSYLGTLFIDRKNRMFVTISPNIWRSTDSGITWAIDTTGLGPHTSSGYSYCDDVFGNIYTYQDLSMWRSAGGTQKWTPVGQSLFSQILDKSSFKYKAFVNNMVGDTMLTAATAYGLFVSSDQGITWNPSRQQISAEASYGFLRTSSGKWITSTNLAVYSKYPRDTVWTKLYPATGYFGGKPIFCDNANVIYTLGPPANPGLLNSLSTVWKSTDEGATWNPDTAGISGLGTGQLPRYFVDETGAQHLGAYDTPAKFYVKTPGQKWSVDTAGYRFTPNDGLTAWGSDRRGSIFAATSSTRAAVWRRSTSGGGWGMDSTGLNNSAVYSFAVDRSGNMIAGTINGVFRKSGGVWTQISPPTGLSGYSAFVVSVDSTGALLAGFSTYVGFNTLWRGVYCTRNNGVTWTKLGLDSIAVAGLVSFGDSTFAYTYFDGLRLVRSGGTGTVVGSTGIPSQFSLGQNYPNPFNPSTTISFQIPRNGETSLKTYDLLGREIETLVNGQLSAGSHLVHWDASRLASGVYFYQLRFGNMIETKKLLLVR